MGIGLSPHHIRCLAIIGLLTHHICRMVAVATTCRKPSCEPQKGETVHTPSGFFFAFPPFSSEPTSVVCATRMCPEKTGLKSHRRVQMPFIFHNSKGYLSQPPGCARGIKVFLSYPSLIYPWDWESSTHDAFYYPLTTPTLGPAIQNPRWCG